MTKHAAMPEISFDALDVARCAKSVTNIVQKKMTVKRREDRLRLQDNGCEMPA